MELQEYLSQSKLKRGILINQASNYLKTATDRNLEKDSSGTLNDSLYQGPNPKRLKQFESQVITQLQKIYKNGIDSQESECLTYKKVLSINERIKRVYSKDSAYLKKRQLVMIPRLNTGKQIRSFAPINRFLNNSPYLTRRNKDKNFLNKTDKKDSSLPSIN